jgi:PIN domain nuclease of toxin-antitoxin system
LPELAVRLISDPQNDLFFSAANLWEIAIKRGLGRAVFDLDPRVLRRGLLDNGHRELAITGDDSVAVSSLPTIHKDPLDRILVARSMSRA